MQKEVYDIDIDTKSSKSMICGTEDVNVIFAPKGQKITTRGKNEIISHIVEPDGSIRVEMITSYNTEVVVCNNNSVEKLLAYVDSFDANSVTLIISYPDHDSKRIFKKQMCEKLKKMGLLSSGASFYIETKENEDGFNMKIKPISNSYDEVTNNLFNKLMKM